MDDLEDETTGSFQRMLLTLAVVSHVKIIFFIATSNFLLTNKLVKIRFHLYSETHFYLFSFLHYFQVTDLITLSFLTKGKSSN